MMPSQAEVDDHYAANHVPFRNWCRACVKGKSVNDPHSSIKRKEDQAVSTVSIDYGYMASESAGGNEEMYMPILVSIDRNTGNINANVVPRKGVNPYVVKRCGQNLQLLGYRKLCVKMRSGAVYNGIAQRCQGRCRYRRDS